MKTKNITKFLAVAIILISFIGCKESFLEEKPMDTFSPENLLVNKSGFESALTALYSYSREEFALAAGLADEMTVGTDVATAGVSDTRFLNDYKTLLPEYGMAVNYWNWCYTKMIKQSNLILSRAQNPDVKWTEAEKNAVTAEAKFFRAWTYNAMVNIFGGVPLVDKEFTEPKYDFSRASRKEVLEFIRKDLEEAAVNLPVVGTVSNGRIYKAAAYHLLAEVYLSLARESKDATFYDKSIDAANKVINGDCGNYKIMTARFGDLSRPGDVFSDLFYTNQQNRASGNLEVIWAWQFENLTIGGQTSTRNNDQLRMWNPSTDQLKTPDNKYTNLPTDSLGRGIGNNVPLNYVKYDIWKSDWANDIRNSRYNIRREFYYNNKLSTDYFGKKIFVKKNSAGKAFIAKADGTLTTIAVDTMRWYYPWIRKTDGKPYNADVTGGATYNDIIKMRLAETYLLRAEAYLLKGDKQKAADDINVVRNRAKAKPVDPANVTIDYLLDERARELIIEEPRRRTLVRMGLLYERATKYNWRAKATMQQFNELWPIPQKAIDANTGAKLAQNPGYPGAQ